MVTMDLRSYHTSYMTTKTNGLLCINECGLSCEINETCTSISLKSFIGTTRLWTVVRIRVDKHQENIRWMYLIVYSSLRTHVIYLSSLLSPGSVTQFSYYIQRRTNPKYMIIVDHLTDCEYFIVIMFSLCFT